MSNFWGAVHDWGRFLVQIEDTWRLEMQMRTKVIDENLADEVDLKPQLKIFADMFFNSPKKIGIFYYDVDERTIRRWEANDDNIEAIKKALQRDSEKLKKYCDVYLGF